MRKFGSTRADSGTTLASCAFKLESLLRNDLQHMFKHFGSKIFPVHNSERFPSYILRREHAEEKKTFTKAVRLVSRSDVDSTANIVSSHLFYEVKFDEGK